MSRLAKRRWPMAAACAMSLFVVGCALPGRPGGQPLVAPIENPLFVASQDREFVWNQVVDELDDYFKIQREQRIQQIGGVLTEGRIDTFPTIGGTLLEPWRHDSTPGFERLQSTLQTVRRFARARVIPTEGGYLIEVAVYKELEDLLRPQNASVGEATQRRDRSLARLEEGEPGSAVVVGWIPQGRDYSLEQQILAELRARLTGVAPASAPPVSP